MDPRELREVIADEAERSLKRWLHSSQITSIIGACLVTWNGYEFLQEDAFSMWFVFWGLFTLFYGYIMVGGVLGWLRANQALDRLREDRRKWEQQ